MMLIRNFVDRKKELENLEKIYAGEGFRGVLIYGRRRVGKTYLIKKLIEDKKSLYLMCLDRSTQENIDNFSRVAASHGLPYVKANNIIEFFERLRPYIEGYIIVMDEFQYLIENDKGILGDMQYVFDEILHDADVMFIICGSSMGAVEKIGREKRSPLYGRVSSRMKINPLDFRNALEFHKNKDLDEAMTIYSAVGGIPLYHSYFKRGFWKDVRDTFFNPAHFLYNEAEFLLREELRDIGRYEAILRSMAEGNTRITGIANSAYMNAKDMPKYISVLMNLGIVRKVLPVTSPPKARNSIYEISDNYFRFWLRFVDRFRGEIEIGDLDEPLRYLKENIDSYVGKTAEDVMRQLLREKYPKVGRWWKKDREIDIVALNERDKEILFGEVKWRNRKIGCDVVDELMEKKDLVQWHNEDRKEKFLIVSKSGFTKKCVERMEDEGILHWDLRDVEKIMNGSL
jgi:AAA+ ATPase superfamily predicted ATPase